ncbi:MULTISPECIES: hypothetical protein [unclassified Shinella]|uniref:hypothetical protein n=1 Tax=unclassified Shinella TaxID=2643062 RepID=UPI0012E30D99|nr:MULTISPECIES: hypothetical protein [unclassified Shinella]
MEHDASGSAASVRANLQIRADEIDVGHFEVAVSFRQAYLVVDAEGGVIAPDSKFGMRVAPEFYEEKTTVEGSEKVSHKSSSHGEGSGETGFSITGLNGKFAGKKSRTKDEARDVAKSSRTETVRKYIPIEAIGDDRWKITEKGDLPLNSYYLTQSQPLCHVVKCAKLSNRYGVSVSVQIRRRDITVAVTNPSRVPLMTPNREAILAALVTHQRKRRLHPIGLAVF